MPGFYVLLGCIKGRFMVFVVGFWHLGVFFYCQYCRNGFNGIKGRFCDKAVGQRGADAAVGQRGIKN